MPALFFGPCRAGDARRKAKVHEVMIGRVKLNLIDAVAISIEACQLRREAVGLPAPLNGLGGTGFGAKIC